MKLRNILAGTLFMLAAMPLGAADYMATAFGIKSNGTTLNTTSIQKAIDYISENGGGRLVFKVGRYLTGSVELKDNVTIDLGEGAVLVASTNPYDYRPVNGISAIVLADGAANIGITGLGVIEGQGAKVAMAYTEQITHGFIKDPLNNGRASCRPRNVYLFNSKNVTIKGININNAPDWTLVCERCSNLLIEKVTINSRAFWNNDGMDIVDCTNTTIQDCFVSATDDGICLKSHSADHACDNIIIRRNTVTSSASAIKFGTVSRGGFKNIRIIDNTVYDTFRSAIALEAVDGALIENVVVDSLRSYNTANPIFLIIGRRSADGSAMRDVSISNVYAEVPSTKPDLGLPFEGPTLEDEPRNVCPCVIVGLEDEPVENLTLENIEIKFPGGADPEYAKVSVKELDSVPEMPKAYPEFSQFKELPAWAFYMRHVKGLTLNNVKVSAERADYRPAVVLHDVQGASISGFKASAPKLKGSIHQYKCTGIKKR
jgi:Endopolygalacturonase